MCPCFSSLELGLVVGRLLFNPRLAVTVISAVDGQYIPVLTVLRAFSPSLVLSSSPKASKLAVTGRMWMMRKEGGGHRSSAGLTKHQVLSEPI